MSVMNDNVQEFKHVKLKGKYASVPSRWYGMVHFMAIPVRLLLDPANMVRAR